MDGICQNPPGKQKIVSLELRFRETIFFALPRDLNQCSFSGKGVYPETPPEVYTIYTLTICLVALKCSSSVLLVYR